MPRIKPGEHRNREKEKHRRNHPVAARYVDDPQVNESGADGIHPCNNEADIEQAISPGSHESPGEEEQATKADRKGGKRRLLVLLDSDQLTYVLADRIQQRSTSST